MYSLVEKIEKGRQRVIEREREIKTEREREKNLDEYFLIQIYFFV